MRRYENKIEGWMSDDELTFLYNVSQGMDDVVEVGSWKGKSTHALLCGCPGTVFAVDHFLGSEFERETAHQEAVKDKDSVYNAFMKNVGHLSGLEVMRTDSLSASKLFNKKEVDMVFIDAGHTYEEVKADINAWLPKVKKLLCGHDYGWEGVTKAVTEKFGNVETVGSIWIKHI